MTAKNKRPIPEDFLASMEEKQPETTAKEIPEEKTIHRQSRGVSFFAAAILADMLKGN